MEQEEEELLLHELRIDEDIIIDIQYLTISSPSSILLPLLPLTLQILLRNHLYLLFLPRLQLPPNNSFQLRTLRSDNDSVSSL